MEVFILKQLFCLGRGDFSRALSKSKPQSLGTEEHRKQQKLFWSLNFSPKKIQAHQHIVQEELTKKLQRYYQLFSGTEVLHKQDLKGGPLLCCPAIAVLTLDSLPTSLSNFG